MTSFFNKYKCYIGCCLICMIHTGINSVAAATMPYLRLYYGCELSTIIAGASACSFAMFLAGFVGARFIRRVKPKGAFYIASLCAALYAFLIFITNNVAGFYIGCASVGFTAAWGGHATSNIYINRFHRKDAATLVATLSGVTMLGGASFQFITGFLLNRIGVRGVYLVMIGFCGVAALINHFLVDPIEAEEDEASRFKKNYGGDAEIAKDPVFQRMVVITLCGSCFTVFGTLCTTFLMSKGIPTELSTTALSAYTLCGGLLALLSGRLADKKGYRFYACYLYFFYAVAIALALVFNATALVPVMIGMLLSFAISSPAGSIYNMLVKPVFGSRSLVAHTLLISVSSLGAAVVLPLFTKLYEAKGFAFLWCVLLAIAAFCFALLMSVIPRKGGAAEPLSRDKINK